MKKIALTIVAILLFVGAGCQVARRLWPVPVTKQAKAYLGEPSDKGIELLGEAEDTHRRVVIRHIEVQMDAKYKMEKDKAKYDLAIGDSAFNIETAKTEFDSMIGTVQKPGWLTTALLGLGGVGLWKVGERTQRPEDYNEAEHQVEVLKAKNGS